MNALAIVVFYAQTLTITTFLLLLLLSPATVAQEVLHPEVLRARSQVSRVLNNATREKLRQTADAASADLTPEEALTTIRSQLVEFPDDWLLQLYFGTRWLENRHQKLDSRKTRLALIERGMKALEQYLERVKNAPSSANSEITLASPSSGPPRVVETEAGLFVLRLLPWPEEAGSKKQLKAAAEEDLAELRRRHQELDLENDDNHELRAQWSETLLLLARRISELESEEILELVPERLSLDRR